MEQINKINVNGVDYQIKDETVPIADNEDISVVMDEETQKESYKLADRPYDEANFSGKGYKILRKNIGDVIDFDAITDVIHVMSDVNPSSDIMEGTYDGDVEYVVLNTTLKEVYGVVSVKVGAWGAKPTYYKNWNGTSNYDRTKFSTEEGKPLDNGIYCISYIKPYKIYKNGNFITYDITNGAPTKKGNILKQSDLSEPNMIYEIRYDFINNFETIIVGKNSVLKFVGGTFSNVNIKFDNTIIENNSNNCIFYNVNIDSYGYLSNEFIYDFWHNDIFGYDVIRSIKGLILTKDYIINDLQHFSQGSANTDFNKIKRSLVIEGQNHSIIINSHNFTTKSVLLAIESIECRNLKILDKANDQKEHIATIFNSAIGKFYSVYFEGFCRLCSNWSYNSEGQSYTELTIHDSRMYTTAFIAENRYDVVDIQNSFISGRPEIRWDYFLDIISIAAKVPKGQEQNAYVNILNSTIIGGWELAGWQDDDNGSFGMYSKININDSYLRSFRIGYETRKTPNQGETILTVKNCHVELDNANTGYHGITHVNFEQCVITTIKDNAWGGCPFFAENIKVFKLVNCEVNIGKDSQTSIFISVDLNNMPEDYNPQFYFLNTNFNISKYITFFELKNKPVDITVSEWAIQHIAEISNCSLKLDESLFSNNVLFIGISDAPITQRVLLPFDNQFIFKVFFKNLSMEYLVSKTPTHKINIITRLFDDSQYREPFNDNIKAILNVYTKQIEFNKLNIFKYLEL